uniref:Major sperm protein n=1 Tax=Steinernema glaseri TaxID=37863 RepID=A0A1I7ZC98_9BILA
MTNNSFLLVQVAMQSLTVAMITGTATVVYPFIQYLPKSSTKYAPLIGQLIWAGSNEQQQIVIILDRPRLFMDQFNTGVLNIDSQNLILIATKGHKATLILKTTEFHGPNHSPLEFRAMQLAHCLASGRVDTHKDDYEENRNAFIGMFYILLGFICITCNLIMLSAIT